MTELEASIEGRVVVKAQEAGWLARKLQYAGRRGAPDRMFIKDGRVVFIEFKRPGGRLSGLQVMEIASLRNVGADVHVCYSERAALNALGIA